MNGIEFKIAREGLHLYQQDLADLWGVALRTVQRWEKGKFAIPKDRELQVLNYYNEIYKAFNGFIKFIEEQNLTKLDEVYLLAYNADNYDGDFEHYKLHLKLLEICKFQLEAVVNVKIIEFNKREYFEWLKIENKKDNQQNRAVWASLQE